MKNLDHIIGIAQICPRRIVLPEAGDERTLRAARLAADSKIAFPILPGDPTEIESLAKRAGIPLDGIAVVDHLQHERYDEWASLFAERRKHKGLTVEDAKKQLGDPLFFGAMMVRQDEADGMVAGAINATANVIRAGLQIIGPVPGIKTVSSSFIMIVPDCKYGAYGAFLFADCGVVPDPNAEQLADIAASTADMMTTLLGIEPIIAMLSFSTQGSAHHPSVDKMIEATQLVRQRRPDLKIDGELQADAAIIEAIGKRKAPDSPVAGHANVLIFPDLNAGNIAYKLTERLANAKAFGPLLQGLALPINDLSRGCSVEDVYNVIAITCVEAHAIKERCHCDLSPRFKGADTSNVVYPCEPQRKRFFDNVFDEMGTYHEEAGPVKQN